MKRKLIISVVKYVHGEDKRPQLRQLAVEATSEEIEAIIDQIDDTFGGNAEAFVMEATPNDGTFTSVEAVVDEFAKMF